LSPPLKKIFYSPRIGDYTKTDKQVAIKIDQNTSAATIYTAGMGSQYKSILPERVPIITTIKWTKYIQKETFAIGLNIELPKMIRQGSFLQPNIAGNTHKVTPIKNTTLNNKSYIYLFKEL
jgi:hypothetical protein